MSHNGTVRCSYCHLTGHNRRKCNDLSGTYKRMYESAISRAKMYAADGETGKAENAAGSAADSRQEYLKRTNIDLATGALSTNKAAKSARIKNVRCGYCSVYGHTRRSCQNVKNDYKVYAAYTRIAREDWYESFKDSGMGIGSMVTSTGYAYDSQGEWKKRKITGLVTEIAFAAVCAHEKNPATIIVKTALELAGSDRGTGIGSLNVKDVAMDPNQRRRNIPLEQRHFPTGSVPEMPSGWLEDVAAIKEVFNTKESRRWEYAVQHEGWVFNMRNALQIPRCSYATDKKGLGPS